jgi:putative lipoprotein
MKRRSAVLAASLTLLAPGAAAAQTPDPDPWFGPDKALHFTLSALITGGGYGVSTVFTEPIPIRIAFGAGLGLTAGAAKELFDLAGFGHPSWKDFAWDVVGVTVGVGIAVSIDLAIRPAAAHGHPYPLSRRVLASRSDESSALGALAYGVHPWAEGAR